MTSLQVNIRNEEYADIFAKLVKNLKFVDSINKLPKNDIANISLIENEEDKLILESANDNNPSKFYGIWSNKEIKNVKKFREKVWQR